MIKKSLFVVAGAVLSGGVYAQSSVTLYGIVDQSVRYATNSNANDSGQIQLTNGAISNSRWGLKGSEDLGGGLKTIFKLENGFDPDTGRANQGGRMFGRQAYVGLSGDLGTVKLGRQTAQVFDFFGEFDPLTLGNYGANVWPYLVTQFRSDNVISYEGNFSGVNVGAAYGLGEKAGSMTANQYWGTRASYKAGPFASGAMYQEFRDASSNKQQMWGAAGIYTIGTVKLFLGYVGAKDYTGITDATLNADPTASTIANPVPSGGNFIANPRKDTIGYLGATYQATPALALTGAFYYDNAKNVNGLAGNGGKRYAGVFLAEYSLSKRTQLYGTVDYNKVNGGSITELPGKSNQTGAAVGIRHIF